MQVILPLGMVWKLRRIAAGLRQFDVQLGTGVTTTRYSAYERGEAEPGEMDRELIERFLPPLPAGAVAGRRQLRATRALLV